MLAHLATVAECLNRSSARVGGGNRSATAGTDVAVPYLWISCILGYLNSITNGFSLVVFILDKKNIIMRRLLLLLSLSETVLNICLAVNFSVMLWVGSRPRAYDTFSVPNLITSVFFTSFMLLNAYIMIRNWCLVMIAGSRCEVVRNPLSTRSGQLFSPHRTLVGYVALSVLSLIIYTPRLFEFTWTVYQVPCNSSNATSAFLLTIRTHRILDARPEYGFFKTLLLFPMQTVLPIFLISGLSFLIIFTLRRRQFPQQLGSLGGAASHRSQDAATKTVMVLLICFVVFELPTFLFFVLNRTVFTSLPEPQLVQMHTTFIGNILVCLDSFSNFIVYSSTSNTFRETVRRVLRLPGAKAAAAAGAAGNYSVIRSVNANLHLSWSANSAHSVRRAGGGCGGGGDFALTPTLRTPTTPTPMPTPERPGCRKSSAEDDFIQEDSGFV